MEKEKKQLGVAFIVVLVAIVMVSAIGIIAMSNKPVVLQGQIEACLLYTSDAADE